METLRLGDIVSLQRRQVSVEASEFYEEIGVRSFGRGLFHKDPVQGADLGDKRVFEIHPGDLVISNVFAWEGAVAVADAAEAGKIGSHRFMTFEVDAARTTASYLRYYFLSDSGLSLIRAASPGSAGRNRTLGIKAFESIEIPLPDIDEQRAIASRLELIQEKSAKALAELDTATDLYGKLVSSLVHRPDLSDAEKKRRGWRQMTIGDFTRRVDRREPVVPGGIYPIAGVYSFGRGMLERPPLRADETKYQTLGRLRTGDFVYSKLGAWEGALAVVPEHYDGRYVSSEFPIAEVDETVVCTTFLRALVSTTPVRDSVDNATRGSMARRRRVRPGDMAKIPVTLPPMEYQLVVASTLAELRQTAHDRSRRKLLEALVPSAINATFADFG